MSSSRRNPFLALAALLAAPGCSWLQGEPAPAPAPDPVPVPVEAPEPPAAPPRTLRTGEVEPAAIGTMEENARGCAFFVSMQPGDGVAPVAMLPGDCPAWFELAWDGRRLVLLDDGVPTMIGRREATPLPEPPLAAAIALRGDDIIVCGTGDEEYTTKDGRIVFDTDGRKIDAPEVPGATGYALARSYKWSGTAWEEQTVGVVPTWTVMADAACTALPDWPGGSRLDPSHPRWRQDDWVDPIPEDATALTAVAQGRWYVDPTRTIAVRGEWIGSAFTVQGPVALWTSDAWRPIEGTSAGDLAFEVQPDWILYTAGEDTALVSRRDGATSWTADADASAFLWPSELPVPPEREAKGPKGGPDTRERPPKHGRPEGRPGQEPHPDHPGKPGGHAGGKPGSKPGNRKPQARPGH